jgi:hypothetical protein
VLLKIPPHTLAQRLQPGAFLIGEFFTIKHDVGIARTVKNTRNYFHAQETTFLREYKKNYAI